MALLDTQKTQISQLPLILQLDVAGNPSRWISYEDSCYYYAKDLVAWSTGQQEITLFGGTNAATGERSSLSLNTIIAVRGKVNDKQWKHINRVPLTNKALFRRDKNVCGYCGNVFSFKELSRDHIVPVSKGGKNKWTNVVTSCMSCNKFKDARTPEQAGMELLYVPYEPNRSEYLILQNHKILADQMQFLLKRVPKHSRLFS